MTMADPCNRGVEKEEVGGKGARNFCLQPKACTWPPDETTSATL
jgi:hypothetical protein